MAPLLPSTQTATKPSAAIRLAFLAADAKPFLRNQSTASSILPLVSTKAFLQSNMPAPVDSLNSFTLAAVISVIFCKSSCLLICGGTNYVNAAVL